MSNITHLITLFPFCCLAFQNGKTKKQHSHPQGKFLCLKGCIPEETRHEIYILYRACLLFSRAGAGEGMRESTRISITHCFSLSKCQRLQAAHCADQEQGPLAHILHWRLCLLFWDDRPTSSTCTPLGSGKTPMQGSQLPSAAAPKYWLCTN